MKKFLLGAVGLVAMGYVAPAIAADLPAQIYSKAPVMIPAAYDWSGIYVGINGGGAFGNSDWTDPVFGNTGDFDVRGAYSAAPSGPTIRSGRGCLASKVTGTGPT